MAGDYVAPAVGFVNDLERFTIGHVPPGSRLLWLHAASVAIKTAAVCALLARFSAWVLMQQLRARRAALALSAPAQRTVLVTRLPPGADAEETFRTWYGEDALERVVPVVHGALLAPLAAEKRALHAEAEAARRVVACGGERPRRRVPAWWPLAERVDSLNYCDEMLLELNTRIAAARRAVLASPPDAARAARLLRGAAFVTFREARTASVAGQVSHACDGASWRVGPAPQPGNIVWDNVGRYTGSQASVLRVAAWALTVCFCALYLLPAAIIQSLTVTSNLLKAFPGLAPVLAHSPGRRAVLEGVLPPLLLFVLTWIWPIFLRQLTVWQGATTRIDVDKGQVAKCFLFNVVIVFISTVLSGAVLTGATASLLHNPQHIPALLAVRVPATSRFFFTLVIIQGVGANAGQMARWAQSIQYLLRATHTENEDAKWPPFHQPFGRFFPHLLLQLQILIIFSTIAPLIQAISLIYFIPAVTGALCHAFPSQNVRNCSHPAPNLSRQVQDDVPAREGVRGRRPHVAAHPRLRGCHPARLPDNDGRAARPQGRLRRRLDAGPHLHAVHLFHGRAHGGAVRRLDGRRDPRGAPHRARRGRQAAAHVARVGHGADAAAGAAGEHRVRGRRGGALWKWGC